MNSFVHLALTYEVVPRELQNLFKPQQGGTRAKGAALERRFLRWLDIS